MLLLLNRKVYPLNLYLLLLLNRKVCPLPILISWEFSRHKYIEVRHNEDNTEKKAGLKYKQYYAHNTLFGAKFVSR